MPDIVSARPVSGEAIATAWGDEVHDMLEGIQTGLVAIAGALAGNSGVSVVLTFPRAYVTPPVVMVMADTSGYNASSVASVTTTGCTVRIYNPTGTTQAAGTVQYRWLAVGKPV